MKHSDLHFHEHTAEGNILVAFLTNLALTIIEFVGGMLSNSMSVVSDAIHDLGCTLTLGLAWGFEKKNHSLAGAIVNAVVLTVSSVVVIYECVTRILNPEEVSAKGMFWIALIALLFKGFAVWRTRRSKNINEHLVSLHLLGDFLGWVIILLNSIVLMFVSIPWLDSVLSILITLFILYSVIYNLIVALRNHTKE